MNFKNGGTSRERTTTTTSSSSTTIPKTLASLPSISRAPPQIGSSTKTELPSALLALPLALPPIRLFHQCLHLPPPHLPPPPPPPRTESRLYCAIKVFLIVVVLLLVFELLACFKGWHFSPPTVVAEVVDFVEVVYVNWLEISARYLAPALQSFTNVCVVLFLVQSFDPVLLVLGWLWIKFRRLKPVAAVEYSRDWENMNVEDYPMVLVQIPMCSFVFRTGQGREYSYKFWMFKSSSQADVQKWQRRGVRILYRHRLIRTGYKAGNLKSAMQ